MLIISISVLAVLTLTAIITFKFNRKLDELSATVSNLHRELDDIDSIFPFEHFVLDEEPEHTTRPVETCCENEAWLQDDDMIALEKRIEDLETNMITIIESIREINVQVKELTRITQEIANQLNSNL